MQDIERLVPRVLDALERLGESTAEDVADEIDESTINVVLALRQAYYDSKVVCHTVDFHTSDDGVTSSVLTWEIWTSYFSRGSQRAAQRFTSGAQ